MCIDWQVKDNILGEESKALNFLHEGELEHTYTKNKKGNNLWNLISRKHIKL